MAGNKDKLKKSRILVPSYKVTTYKMMEKHQLTDFNKSNIDVYRNNTLKDTPIPLDSTKQSDVQKILEHMNVTNDMELQTKLFSILSGSLLLNEDTNFETVIRYTAVYDRINEVLEKGVSQKALHALNFLSTLLCVDAEDRGPTKRRTLALYAKNMTRTSGCLGTMLDMFTNCMMYHDTWKALCQCLAAACRDNNPNQTYCTHLIPVCIQRSNQTNLDVFLVLQSLLLHHNNNMEIFLNNNGFSIFTRELLHYDRCLQLLMTVVAAVPSSLLQQPHLLNDLREFLRLYGPGSQIGQKATIILNHVGSCSRGVDFETKLKQMENVQDKLNNTENLDHNENDKLDDTTTLMQNIVKEVYNFKQSQVQSLRKTASKTDLDSLIRSTSTMMVDFGGHKYNKESNVTNASQINGNFTGPQQNEELHANNAELSFSFLLSLNSSPSCDRNQTIATIKTKCNSRQNQNANSINKQVVRKPEFATSENKLPYFKQRTTSTNKSVSIEPQDFNPIFSSTLKHDEESTFLNIFSNEYKNSLITLSSRTRKVAKRSPKKLHRPINDTNVKNTSLSSRLFSAINESCTTLVKTVANIFKKNEPSDYSKHLIESESRDRIQPCSFSFFKYMEKRDAIFSNLLKTSNKDYTDFSFATDSCDTCDTQALKKKMAKNKHLKKTIKKLKLGVYLYGCDFKKISRTMWPRESYMTPTVLYKLYRKLLLK